MVIRTVCGSGLGSSLLIAMNVRYLLDKLGIDYDEVEHTNVSSFTANGVDFVVCGADVAPALDFPEERKVILNEILNKDELEAKLLPTLKKFGKY